MELVHHMLLGQLSDKHRLFTYMPNGALLLLSTFLPQQERGTSLSVGAQPRQRLPESPGVIHRREVSSCLQYGKRTALSTYIKAQTESSIHILSGFTLETVEGRTQTVGTMLCRKYTVHLEEVQSSTHAGSLTPLRYWLYPLR